MYYGVVDEDTGQRMNTFVFAYPLWQDERFSLTTRQRIAKVPIKGDIRVKRLGQGEEVHRFALRYTPIRTEEATHWFNVGYDLVKDIKGATIDMEWGRTPTGSFYVEEAGIEFEDVRNAPPNETFARTILLTFTLVLVPPEQVVD